MKTQVKLEQTKGQFKLMGKVKGVDNENSYREGVTSSDKEYKSLSFMVETSPTNTVRVELFGMERDTVYAWSSKEKKSKPVPFTDRFKNHGSYKVMGVGCNLEKGSDGKNIPKTLVEFDAVDYLLENLNEGDSVFVRGQIDYQEYKDQQGEIRRTKRYQIQSISRTKEELDFGAEDFEPMSSFDQYAVVSDTMKEEGKVIIGAKIIKYNGEVVDTEFVLYEEKYPKLAKKLQKTLKFGDLIKFQGYVVNAVELTDEPMETDDDDWGGETPKGMDEYIKKYIQELEVTNVDKDTYEPKKYKEEDFVNEDQEAFGDNDPEDEDDIEEDTDLEDEELPFG